VNPGDKGDLQFGIAKSDFSEKKRALCGTQLTSSRHNEASGISTVKTRSGEDRPSLRTRGQDRSFREISRKEESLIGKLRIGKSGILWTKGSIHFDIRNPETRLLLSVVNGEGVGPKGCKVPKKTCGPNLNKDSGGESKEPLRLEGEL
jgi:hypothetical protein